MRFVLYWGGCILLSALWAMSGTSDKLTLSFANLLNLVDLPSILYVLAFCLLSLLCTRSFRAFGRAFRVTLPDSGLTATQCRESATAVRLVSAASLAAGGLSFFGALIQILCRQDIAATSLPINLACIVLYYSLLLNLLLLPVYVALTKQRMEH